MYIGNTVITQGFTPQVDFFSGNASTTAFTLSRPVASVYQMIVNVANVDQNPGSAYTVSGNTITFSSAPPSGTNNIWVEYTSLITQTIVPTGSYQVAGPVFVGSTIGYTDTGILQTFASNVNSYNQIILQNLSSGANASTNFNVSNNNGTSTTNYGEFGINSSGFSGTGSFSQAGYTYLASASTDLVLGTYGNNPIHFVVNSGATDAAIIDVNGNFGLGVTPSTWNTGKSLSVYDAGSSLWSNANGSMGIVANAYYNSGWKYQATGAAARFDVGNANGTTTWGYAASGSAGTALTWTTGMTLDNSGTFIVGSGSAPAYLKGSVFIPGTGNISGGVVSTCFVNFNYPASGQPGFPVFVGNDLGPLWGIGQHNSSTTATTDVRIGIVTTSGTTGFIWNNTYPALYSGSYTNASDYRIKENVVNYPDGALTQVNQLRPISYKIKDASYQKGEESGIHVGKNEIGFLAHEVQAIIPLVVTGEKDAVDANGNEAHQGVDYGRMVTVLVKAIQEMSSKLKAANIEGF